MRTLAVVGLLAVAARAGPADAERLFRTRCASCHTVPDPALRTDRTWLEQVHRTT